MATRGKYRKVIFSETDIDFIKENFKKMTNNEISAALGISKTIVRAKAYELGLQRMTLVPWPEEANQYFLDHYKAIGDSELCRIFNIKFPKPKGWCKNDFQNKFRNLGLARNKLDWYTIKERNRRNGSFGKMDVKNNPEPPKVYVIINRQTRVELKPGQTEESVKAKFNHLNPR